MVLHLCRRPLHMVLWPCFSALLSIHLFGSSPSSILSFMFLVFLMVLVGIVNRRVAFPSPSHTLSNSTQRFRQKPSCKQLTIFRQTFLRIYIHVLTCFVWYCVFLFLIRHREAAYRVSTHCIVVPSIEHSELSIGRTECASHCRWIEKPRTEQRH